MTIVLYDKDRSVEKFLQRFESAASSRNLSSSRFDDDADPETLSQEQAQLIVAHITNGPWQHLLEHSSGDGILLRVSSAGLADAPPPEVINQRYVLHLIRPAKDLTEVDCGRLLEVLSDITKVKALIYDKQPQDIYRYFARETVSNLVALCILCQGYLAIHAEKEGQDWGPSDINSALNHMNWPSVAETAPALLGPDLDKKRREVESPGWWSSIFSETKSKDELEEQIARELGVAAIGKSPSVKELVDAMYRETPIPPRIVAGAYCAISERLSGRTCAQR
jgi:hypothetical protein